MERNDLSLGERLAGLRKARGLSQDQLAELLDVSRQTVSRWEVGEAAPTAENRKKLSQLYAVPLESLTDTPGWTPPPAGDPEPLPEEIAKELDMPVERVREILKISQEPVSLETPIGEEEDSHLGDFIQDDNVPVPAEAAAQTLLKEQLDEVLDTLTEREQKVLRLRFGMNDGRARTLEEVGKEFDVTRERIRQIEAKALRKLRHPSRSRKLRDYLD